MEKLASKVLNKVLGTFIENLDSQQMDISLFSGKVSLVDLQLKKDFLYMYGLPFQINYGIVKKILLDIPLMNLDSKPVKLSVCDVYLYLKPKNPNGWTEAQEKEYLEKSKAGKIKGFEEMLEAEEDSDQELGFFKKKIRVILNNIEIHLENLYIRYEHSLESQESFTIGFFLRMLEIHSSNEKWEKAFVSSLDTCYRFINIDDISIFIDYSVPHKLSQLSRSSHLNAFDSIVKKEIERELEHNYLIEPTYLQIKMLLNQQGALKDKALVNLDIEITKTKLVFYVEHPAMMKTLLNLIKLHNTFIAGVKKTLKEKPIEAGMIQIYSKKYREYRESLKAEDKKKIEKLFAELEYLEQGIFVEDILESRNQVFKMMQIELCKQKIEVLLKKKQSKKNSLFKKKGSENKYDDQINKLNEYIIELETGNENSKEIGKLAVVFRLIQPSLEIFEDTNSPLLYSSVKKIFFNFAMIGKDPKLDLTVNDISVEDKYLKSEFHEIFKLEEFRFSLHPDPSEVEVTCSKSVVFFIIPTIHRLISLIKTSLEKVNFESSAIEMNKYLQHYVKNGLQFLSSASSKPKTSKKSSMMLNVNIDAPLIYFPSKYSNSNNSEQFMLCIDFGNIKTIYPKMSEDEDVKFQTILVQLTELSIYFIVNWDSFKKNKQCEKRHIFIPVNISLSVLKPNPTEDILVPIEVQITSSPFEFVFNTIYLQTFKDILEILNENLPNEKTEEPVRTSQISRVQELVLSKFSPPKVRPKKINLDIEKFVFSFSAIQKVGTFTVDSVKISMAVDEYKNPNIQISVFEILLTDERSTASQKNVIYNPQMIDWLKENMKNKGKNQLVLNISKTQSRGLLDIGVNMMELHFYFNIDWLINLKNTFQANSSALNFLKTMTSKKKKYGATYRETKVFSSRFTINFQHLDLTIPVVVSDSQLSAHFSLTSTMTFESSKNTAILLSEFKSIIDQSVLSKNDELTVVFSHIQGSILSKNNNYTFLQPSRIMIESKIEADFTKNVSINNSYIRMESIVLFLGFSVLDFFKLTLNKLKELKNTQPAQKKNSNPQTQENKITLFIDIDALQVFILNDQVENIQCLVAQKCSYLTFNLSKINEKMTFDGIVVMNTDYFNQALSKWEPVVEDTKLSIKVNQNGPNFGVVLDFPDSLNLNITKELIEALIEIQKNIKEKSDSQHKKSKKSKVKIVKSLEYVFENRLDFSFQIWVALEGSQKAKDLHPNKTMSLTNDYIQKLSTLLNKKEKSTSLINSFKLPTVINFKFSGEARSLNIDKPGFFIFPVEHEEIKYEILVHIFSDTGRRFIVFDSLYKLANNTDMEVTLNYKEESVKCLPGSMVTVPLTWTTDLSKIECEVQESTFLYLNDDELNVNEKMIVHQISKYSFGEGFFSICEVSFSNYILNLLHVDVELLQQNNKILFNEDSVLRSGEECKFNFSYSDNIKIKVLDQTEHQVTQEFQVQYFENEIFQINAGDGKSIRLSSSEKVFSSFNFYSTCFEKHLFDLSSLEKLPSSEKYPKQLSIFSDYIIINKTNEDLLMENLALPKLSTVFYSTDSNTSKLKLNTESSWSKEFKINTIGVSGAVETTKKGHSSLMSFGILISQAPHPLNLSVLISIVPRFVILNYLDIPLYVKQTDQTDEPLLIPKGHSNKSENTVFYYKTLSKKYSISVSADSVNWSGPFSIEHLNDIQLKIPDEKVKNKLASEILFQSSWYLPSESFKFRFIRVLITSTDQSTIQVAFINPKDPDFKVFNNSDQTIECQQVGVEGERYKIASGSWINWAWDDHTVSDKKLLVFYEEESAKFSIEKVSYKKTNEESENPDEKSAKIKNIKNCIGYMKIKDATRILMIELPGYVPEENPSLVRGITQGLISNIPVKGQDTLSLSKPIEKKYFSLELKVKDLGISIIDQEYKELFFFSFKDLSFFIDRDTKVYFLKQEKSSYVNILLKHFQIDSCDPDPDLYPVIFSPLKDSKNEETCFFMFEVEIIETLKKNKAGAFLPAMTIIENFDLLLQKIQIKLNEETILKFLKIGKFLKFIKTSKKLQQKNPEVFSTELEPIPYQDTSNTQKFYFHLVKIGVIHVSFSFQKSLKPSKNTSLYFLRLLKAFGGELLSISNTTFVLSELFIINSFQTRRNFLNILIKNYVKQGITQGYKIFASIDIIGNPLSLVQTLGTGVYEFITEPAKGLLGGPKAFAVGLGKGVKALSTSIVKGTFESASKITGGLYNVLKSATGEEKSSQPIDSENIGKNFVMGLKEGAKDVYKGFSGVVLKPYLGAKNKGAKGLAKGIISGTVGLFVSPFKLVLKLSSVITGSVASTASLIIDGKIQSYGRARFPRSWNSVLGVEVYNEAFAQAQAYIMSFKGLAKEKVVYYSEISLLADNTIKKNCNIFLIITLNWLIYTQDGKLKKKIELLDLENLEIHRFESLFMLAVIAKKDSFIVPSPDFAALACIYNRLSDLGLKETGSSIQADWPKLVRLPKSDNKN